MSKAAIAEIDEPVDPPRPRVAPAIELLIVSVAAAVAVGSYFYIAYGARGQSALLSPPLVAMILVANIVPTVALFVLIGRRIARRRAAQTQVGGTGRLHVRLVALFSILAAVPMILVTVFASLLLQYGVDFWSSDRARGMLENASTLVRENYQNEINRVVRQTLPMSGDLAGYLRTLPIDSLRFKQGLFLQTYRRELSEAMILNRADPRDPLIVLNPYGRPLQNIVTPQMMDQLDHGAPYVVVQSSGRAGALVPIAYGSHNYLYAARVFDEQLASQLRRGNTILSDYRALQSRSRTLQLRFNAALLIISLLIVGLAVLIALTVADRLVRPVGELVSAARLVAAGDLTARVSTPRREDEIGALATAFNRMTARLQEQTGALVAANDQLESRRALIEAVMSGVTAGVILVGKDGAIRLINASAIALLRTGEAPVGRLLADIAPELDALVGSDVRNEIVQLDARGEPLTLAVKIARVEAGLIFTFDDITQQQLDQRRAAWADVARRIAHEIKNPLTPIQLAAERLQRRYGNAVEPQGGGTFQQLTDTIVRQVGDLRRMVDEFSSFARMPKPVFRDESFVELGRQALFLHEVAHPNIRFSLDYSEPAPHLVCDRRQIGQALTNIVKNAVEAIDAKGEGAEGHVWMAVAETGDDGRSLVLTVADDGIGLPIERDRIIEPYMTTRARGTGLGLAIVKKIVEEHLGTMTFADRPGGGTIVTLSFDRVALAQREAGDEQASADPSPTNLKRIRSI